MIKWKNIFNDNYSVSNTGIIKANNRYIIDNNGARRYYKEKILLPEKTKDGHLRVTLCDSRHKKRFFIHRLVAEAFIPNPNNLPVINHKDENPNNNNANNLEWCTISYNNNYNNRQKKIGDKEGVTIKVFYKNKLIETYPSISKFCKKYNIPLTTAWRRLKDGKTFSDNINIVKVGN